MLGRFVQAALKIISPKDRLAGEMSRIKVELDGTHSAPSSSARVETVEYPDVVVGVVVRRRRTAMLRRASDRGTMWAFPGGKVEEGETHEEAVVRELRRETGLECRVVERIGERLHPVSGRPITYFLCKAQGGKSRGSAVNRAEDIRWLTLNEIDGVTKGSLFDKVRAVIRREIRISR